MTTRKEREEPIAGRCRSGVPAARLSAYLDGELSAAERTRLEQHVDACTTLSAA
jgi:anti-sigma factor RsiW